MGPTPLSRLTAIEYQSLVADLLGEAVPPAALQISDTKVGAFDQNFELVLSETSAGQYLSAAEALATTVVQNWAVKSGCASFEDAACNMRYLLNLATRAFRGATTDADKERLTLLATTNSELSAQARVQVALQAVFLSPKFLFTVPAAAESRDAHGPGTTALSPAELAGRLSLALWKSSPDEALLQAAAQVSNEVDAAALARSMLGDARSARMFQDFVTQWLGLDNFGGVRKSVQMFPEFAGLQSSMGEETQALYASSVKGGGALSSLLNAPTPFSNPALASAYSSDVSAVRLGILTQPSFLSQHAHPEKASPVKRGLMLRERLLCDPVSPPPPGVQTQVNVNPGESSSAAFAAHSENPVCATCHQYLDGIGQGFNQFDAIGRYLPNEAAAGFVAAPVRAVAPDISGAFASLQELTSELAQSEHVAQCYTLELARYLLRRPEGNEDACALKRVYQGFKSQSYTLSEALVQVASSDLFRFRRVESGGVP